MARIEKNTAYGDKRKRFSLIFIFLFFLAVISLLVFSAFFNNGEGIKSLTGLVSFSGNSFENISQEGIYLQTSLSVPEIKHNQEFERIEITKAKESSFNIGDSVYSGVEEIALINFEGDFHFSKENILKVDGKSEKVVVEGNPVSSQSRRRIKTSLDGQSEYSSIDIYGIMLKKLDYVSDGSIIIGSEGTEINLKKERIILENFGGDLKVQNDNLMLEGYLNKITKKGENTLTISS